MTRFWTTWVSNGLALAVAAALLGSNLDIGDNADSTWTWLITLALVAVLFTVVNVFIAPIVKILSIPFIFFTFGLFLLVINALLLLLTEWLADLFGISFTVDGFWIAVLASIIISIVNGAVGIAFRR
ncbi:MAG: hypothetical protein JWP10_29 [Nocardioidaceae bacterium]|nr:hypothetical protein [Nocardioidaceae bacterium]